MRFQTIKSFPNLPCAHQQWFDTDKTGELFSGDCAKFHGYDRTVTMKIEGEVDNYGWVFPFGAFKAIRSWLEYYFDHTAVISADDPRLDRLVDFNNVNKVFELRILPAGVSMEMSALFIWSITSLYVYAVTQGRCHLVEVECREHEKNASTLKFDTFEAEAYCLSNFGVGKTTFQSLGDAKTPEAYERLLHKVPVWAAITPQEMIKKINEAVIEGYQLSAK